eukprot:Filipodium_phascolosomae@DN2592_c0_g1_i4.p2
MTALTNQGLAALSNPGMAAALNNQGMVDTLQRSMLNQYFQSFGDMSSVMACPFGLNYFTAQLPPLGFGMPTSSNPSVPPLIPFQRSQNLLFPPPNSVPSQPNVQNSSMWASYGP